MLPFPRRVGANGGQFQMLLSSLEVLFPLQKAGARPSSSVVCRLGHSTLRNWCAGSQLPISAQRGLGRILMMVSTVGLVLQCTVTASCCYLVLARFGW
jgi:hypothetical protein